MTASAFSPERPLAILTAMPDEARALTDALDAADPGTPGTGVAGRPRRIEHGGRVYRFGELWGLPVVVAVARCGKVAAAVTTTELIARFEAAAVVCTGVAGGLGEGVAIGDVVVADVLVQHDLDPRPLWPRHVVPLLETGEFPADAGLANRLEAGARAYAACGAGGAVHRGLIASGDQFVHGPVMGRGVREALPQALCVEMEGAAVAQVCYEYSVPCAVVRTISDRADDDAPADFGVSLGAFAASHTFGILSRAFGSGEVPPADASRGGAA